MDRTRFTRRELLLRGSTGFGLTALAGLMARPTFAGLADGTPGRHHPPRARHVVFCFMSGGVSQVLSLIHI